MHTDTTTTDPQRADTGRQQGSTTGRERPDTTVVARLRLDRRDTMRFRLRRQIRPHLIVAGLWAAGAVGHLAAGTAGDVVLVATTAATFALAAAGGLAVARRRAGRATTARQAVVVLAAAGWLAWAVLAGPGWTATTVLLAGGYTAGLAWWRRWRIPDPAEDPGPPPGPDPTHPPKLWKQHIAGGGPLPGSYLHSERATTTGLRYRAQLVPGRHSLGRALAALPELRTGLLLRPDQDLILEQDPDTDESVISVTIVRRSPMLTTAVPWPGPTYHPEAGSIDLGPYVDGEGVAGWLLHTDNGLWGGFLAGSTGSGKSRMLDSIALGVATAGCVVWYADPQGGASSPFLIRHADHRARDLDGIRGMLSTARQVKQLRQAENAVNDWEGWTPDQHRPGLVIIIDESHGPLADPECQKLATELAREGRKVGIALILASQVATLDAFGGGAGADALRSSVCSGNLLILRSKTYNTRNVLPGVDVDPTKFPRIPGYAYLIDDTGRRRTAPLRGYWLADEARNTWGARITWPALDPATAGAAGDDYRHRRQRTDADRAALVEWLNALREGRQPAEPTSSGNPGAGGPVRAPKVIPFPSWRRWQRRTSVDAVYDLVAAGVTSPGELETRTGYSETAVRNALRHLADTGRVTRDRHGVWTVPPGDATSRTS